MLCALNRAPRTPVAAANGNAPRARARAGRGPGGAVGGVESPSEIQIVRDRLYKVRKRATADSADTGAIKDTTRGM